VTARSAFGAALALVGAFALATVAAGPAAAHNTVVATSPAEDAVVTEQPGIVSLTTSDDLIDIGGSTVIQVVGPDGRHFETSCATVEGPVAEVPAELGAAGEYTVVWQVVSADGHPIGGEFGFEWAPAEGQVVGAGSDAPTCESAAAATPGDDDSGDAEPAASVPLGDVLWIGGGVLVVIAAALGTWLVVRRRA
jgi:copper resistance protein C